LSGLPRVGLMRPNKVFPKDNEEKTKETKKDLKAKLRKAEKEIKQLKNEIENLKKPVRTRKKEVSNPTVGSAEWREDFVKRFKEGKKTDEKE